MKKASHSKDTGNSLHAGSGQLIPSEKLELQSSGEDLLAVVRHLALQPDARVLEVGCGSGALSLAIARQLGPNAAVFGVDLSYDHVEYAREVAQQAGQPNLHFLQGDIAEQIEGLSGDFDVVLCRYVLMYMLPEPNALAFLRHMKRWAGDKGAIACIEPDVNFSQYRHPKPSDDLRSVLDETVRYYFEKRIMDWRCGVRLYDYLRKAGFRSVDVSLIDGRIICGGEPKELVDHDNMDLEQLLAPVLEEMGWTGHLYRIVEEWRTYSKSEHNFLYTPIFMGIGRM